MGFFKIALISVIAVSVVAVAVGVTVYNMNERKEEAHTVEHQQEQQQQREEVQTPALKRTLLRNNFHNLDIDAELEKVQRDGIEMEAGVNGLPHFFSIEENLTTGFMWIIDYEACKDVLDIDEDFDAPVEIEDLVGAPGTKQMEFNGQGVGTCTFQMAYAKSWEFQWDHSEAQRNDYIDNNNIQVVRIPVTVSN